MVALLALVALGCEETATELVVVIDTNLHACGEVDEIALAVTGPTAMSEPLVAPLVGPDRVELPLVHGLVPGSDALGPVEIIATARYRGRDVMSERVRTELVDGEIKMVSLVLDYRCRGATFCGEDETCDAGRCVSVQRDGAALPSWDGAPAPLDHGAADLSRCRTESEGVCQPVQLVVGAEHACVLCDSGVVVCWGGTRDGQVGNGYDAPGDYEYALPIVVSDLGPPDGVAKLGSTSANDTCAMLDGGDVRCWGRNADRQIDGGDCVTSEEECSWPRLFPTAIATQPSDVDTPIRDIGMLRSRYYLRFSVVDKPGVLSKISGVLGHHNISIASVIQKGRRVGETVPLVMMTHHACERDMRAALREIDQIAADVTAKTVLIRVENGAQ